MPKSTSIAGVRIDALGAGEVVRLLRNTVSAKLPIQVATINPEFVVRAQRDDEFRTALHNTELSVADGIGVRAAAYYLALDVPRWQPARLIASLALGLWVGLLVLFRSPRLQKPIPETVSGVDLIWALAELGNALRWRFYLLGGEQGAAERAASRLRAQFPNLIVLGAEEGLSRQEFPDPVRRGQVATRIGKLRPDIVLVAFGAPKQDTFIAEQRTALAAPVMMGVGGSFDFIAGDIRRAPLVLRRMGLEWFWRLILQPWRWRRILTATIVFPFLVFRQKTGVNI